jgi:type I restriction enzyme M protein
MVALPSQLFYSVQIPVCLWFLSGDKSDSRFRHRPGETLFIDARALGSMVDRTHRELTSVDIARIASTYHAWRGDGNAAYANVPGFSKGAGLDEIRGHAHILTPGRYVGAANVDDDREPFEEKMQRLVSQLQEQQAQAVELNAAIGDSLRRLGYDS